jgi:hypothetical protein
MVDQASSAADSASCSRTSHCRPQNGVRAAAAHHTSTALCVRGPRSAVRVIGVIAAAAEKVSAAGVDPTPQATHLCCEPLRPSMGTRSRPQRQVGVCCALNLQHDLYGAAPPAPFKSSAALLLPTGSRGGCANSLTQPHPRCHRSSTLSRAIHVTLRRSRDFRDDVSDGD